MIRKLHLYTALVLGVIFALIGLSGSWLVFYPHFDSVLLDFDTRVASTGAIHWQRALEIADESLKPAPGVTMMQLPFGTTGPVLVTSQMGPDMMSTQYDQAYVDAAGGRVLATKSLLSSGQSWSKNITGVAVVLHTALILGDKGYWLMAVLGAWLLVTLLTGAWMWWPRGPWRRSSFLVTSRPRSRAFLGDLHRICGLYAFPFLLLLTLTGIYFGFRPYVERALARPSHSSHEERAARTGGEPISLDQIVAAAQARFPSRPLQSIMLMRGESTAISVSLAPEDGAPEPVGATEITFTADGSLTAVRDPALETAAQTLLRWIRPIHTGAAFGSVGKWIVFVTGLLPLGFLVTGVWIWMRRSAVKRA